MVITGQLRDIGRWPLSDEVVSLAEFSQVTQAGD